jgi:flagellar basal body P-ring formation protein FlgA
VFPMIKSRLSVFALGMVFFTPSHAGGQFQSLDAIYAFVKETIAKNMSPSAEYEITVLPIDEQLKLQECTKTLEVFKANEQMKAGRVSIGVRCNAEKKWSIFVSAVIKVYESVIVLTRPVQRGELITGEYLAVEKKDISNARGDFVTEFNQVANKEAARNMPAGAILGLKSVVVPPLIKRKDKVIISTGQADFSIQMSGTAMMEGAKGQLIKVKNDSSGRIISGTVIEPGIVFVK